MSRQHIEYQATVKRTTVTVAVTIEYDGLMTGPQVIDARDAIITLAGRAAQHLDAERIGPFATPEADPAVSLPPKPRDAPEWIRLGYLAAQAELAREP